MSLASDENIVQEVFILVSTFITKLNDPFIIVPTFCWVHFIKRFTRALTLQRLFYLDDFLWFKILLWFPWLQHVG